MTDRLPPQPPHLAFTPRTSGRSAPGWWNGVTSAQALAVATAVVPRVLAQAAAEHPEIASWHPATGTRTSTGTAVFPLLADGRPEPVGVLRLTATCRDAMRRDTEVLAVLAELDLPDSLAGLLPHRLHAGDVEPFSYVLDVALPGRSAELLVGVPIWNALQAEALDAVSGLHRATARELVVDDAVLRHWVDEPLAVVARMCRRLPLLTPRDRLPRLRDLLCQELQGRTVKASWVHGDFWAGNLLTGPTGALSGIVDWDLASVDELPVHDYLHLVLYRRRAVTGQELGDLVRGLYADDGWTHDERTALAGADWAFPDGAPPLRVLLLLQWLRHIAAVSVQQRSYITHSVRVWELRNVHAVLRSL